VSGFRVQGVRLRTWGLGVERCAHLGHQCLARRLHAVRGEHGVHVVGLDAGAVLQGSGFRDQGSGIGLGFRV